MNKKQSDYFSKTRSEIFPLLPEKFSSILEIGCGAGKTLEWIKKSKNCVWIGGVELSDDAARQAQEITDWICVGDIEKINLPIEKNSLDVILCLDVLEHLKDPWSVVGKLHKLLKKGGVLIASIPNIRNYAVLLPLVFGGEWDYVNEGILDRTHLRFFTRNTAIKLLECSGLIVEKIIPTGIGTGKKRVVNILTFSLFKRFLEFQYIIRAYRDN